MFGFAPLDNSNSTIEWCPSPLATCNGMSPYYIIKHCIVLCIF